MARLNRANVLAHFSHSGIDDMADNTCHFGINNFFADNGLPEEDRTRLYFPSDALQMKAILHAVETMKARGMDVGLINKPTLNIIDPDMLQRAGSSPFVLVVETQNVKTGLGSRYGTWLLENGFTPRYGIMGTAKEGHGGLSDQIPFQGMDTAGIISRVEALIS